MSNVTHNVHFVLNFDEQEFTSLVRSIVRGTLLQLIGSYGYAIHSAETNLLHRVFYLTENGYLTTPQRIDQPDLPILVLEVDLSDCLHGLRALQNHLNDRLNPEYHNPNLFHVHSDDYAVNQIGCDENGIFIREFRDLTNSVSTVEKLPSDGPRLETTVRDGPGTGFELPLM